MLVRLQKGLTFRLCESQMLRKLSLEIIKDDPTSHLNLAEEIIVDDLEDIESVGEIEENTSDVEHENYKETNILW